MQLLTHFGPNALHWVFNVFKEPRIFWPVLVAASGAGAHWWRQIRRNFKTRFARNWPATPAVIDVISVVERVVSEKIRVYVATLTYFYRNPNLQMGEFEREFQTRSEAQQWAEQFKGRSVMVHVNPADSTDSVLIERDLAGLELHRPLKLPTPKSDVDLSDDYHEALTPGLRLVCGLGELVSTAGLATCAVLLAVSIVDAGRIRPSTFYWAGGAMLVCSLSAVFLLWLHLKRTEAGRSLLHNYSRWCPPWMRWSLRIFRSFRRSLALFPSFTGRCSSVLAPLDLSL